MSMLTASLAIAAALMPAVALVSCRRPQSADVPPQSRPLALVVSGDTQGWIMPCGCASKQSGGLARRGVYVSHVREEAEVIVADVGGAPGGTARYDRLKFAAILAGEQSMNIAAHNLGAAEIMLGADELRRLARETGVPFVSANLTDADGKPIADPARLTTAGGRRVALVGVTSPRFATERVLAADPRSSVVEALAALKARNEKFDAVIVLAYLPTDELAALADRLPEADIVIGGPTLQSIPPRLSGPKTLVASVTNKGKFLARFDAPPPASKEGWRGQIVDVDDSLPDDTAQMANLERYRRELAQLDLPASDTGFVTSLGVSTAADYRVAGTESCRECHESDAQVWHDSRHAAAWHTLVERGWQVDSFCQHCHTTGFGLPGGFVSAERTAERGNVGCESCHGPSQAHQKDPARHRTTFVARDQCMSCHDRENSPQFSYDTYWQQIVHGARLPPKADATHASEGRKP